MTWKDYVLIAKALHSWSQRHAIECPAMLETLADALQEDNPRFNREKFITACKVEKAP
jgi:hypothetical protein